MTLKCSLQYMYIIFYATVDAEGEQWDELHGTL